MAGGYATTVKKLGWLVDSVERHLANTQEGAEITGEAIRGLCPGRRATSDEAIAVLQGLADIGVLSSAGRAYRLSAEVLTSTAPYRSGVRAGIATADTREASVRLCAALPSGLPSPVEWALRHSSEDLRGAVVNLVAGAKDDLVIASPFWDAATLQELAPMLERRLDAGVAVRLLGRFGAVVRDETLARLGRHTGCRLLSWYEPSEQDPFGAQTFHFKAVVIDRGEKAYLGTANFTTSGLRSRLELGFLLEGEPAGRLATVVEAVLGLARRVMEDQL